MHNPFIGCRFMATPGWPQCWGSSIAPMGGSGGHPQDTGGRSPSTNRPKGLRDSNSTLHLSSGPSLEANNCGVLHSKMQVHSDKALETCLISRTPRVPQATWKKGAAWQLDPAGTRTQGETPNPAGLGFISQKFNVNPPKNPQKRYSWSFFGPFSKGRLGALCQKFLPQPGLRKPLILRCTQTGNNSHTSSSPYLLDKAPEDRVAIHPPSVECTKESGSWPKVKP